MPASGGEGTVVGRSVLRLEDRPLLTGSSAFVDDFDPPDAIHAAVLRSVHAHALLSSVDGSAAAAHPGVVDVVTAEDIPDKTLIPMRMYSKSGMERFLQPPLAGTKVRYSGEPVAVVLAESRYLAEDALGLIDVAYEPLAPVLDGDEALATEAPLLFPEAETNLVAEFEIAHGNAEAAFESADIVVEQRLACQRHAAVPMETRGLVASPDERTGKLTVWGASKIVHINRLILARLLDWPEDRLRLIEMDVGGGFGARGEFYPEDYLVPFCALRLRRPVKWVEDREEHLRTINHSREQLHDIAIALSSNGEFLGLRDRLTFNTGAYVRTHGLVVPTMSAALLPGPYRWGSYSCRVRHVVSNKTPAGTYRAPGRYEANFARERIVDIAARQLGMDPVELRRRNLVQPQAMPYPTGTDTDGHPVAYDSGDYPLLLDKGLKQFGWKEMLEWRDRAPAGKRRGIGFAFFVEKSGIARWDYARVELNGEGTAIVHVGSASLGQGVETVLAQICAEGLGISYAQVSEVRHGDTDDVPEGVGSFGSRATMIAGTAVMKAAQALRGRLLKQAAELLEAAERDLTISDGRIAVRGSPARAVSLRELAATSGGGTGEGDGLSEEARFSSDDMSFPYGLHCVALEVDLETGGVEVNRYAITYDVGRAVNAMLVEGQIVGGAAQGLGGALLEELSYDPGGQLSAGSFMDYLLPTAGEMPAVDVLVTEDAPTPLTPLGAKGAGEGGTAAAGAAIANAVSDAVGVEATELPLSPERVLNLARSAGERSQATSPSNGGR